MDSTDANSESRYHNGEVHVVPMEASWWKRIHCPLAMKKPKRMDAHITTTFLVIGLDDQLVAMWQLDET